MKRALLSSIAFLLLSCGGEDSDVDHARSWAGSYTGTQRIMLSCTDGSNLDQTLALSPPLALSRSAKNVINIPTQPASPCLVQADVTETTATVRPGQTCPAISGTNGTSTTTWTGGTLSLNPPELSGTLTLRTVFSAFTDTCSGSNTFQARK